MRVITGSARGRKLAAPAGQDTRPTSDMAKEAIFSIIQFEVEGARVLDLFAGSGQMGIEALSRGAREAVFVDKSRDAQTVIFLNLEKTGLKAQARVVLSEALTFLRSNAAPYDIAFLDPPYNQGILDNILPLVDQHMQPSGVIICESMRGERLPEAVGAFSNRRDYRYGKAQVTTYRQPEEADS